MAAKQSSTKQIIEDTTGVSAAEARVNYERPDYSHDDVDAPPTPRFEAFPCYAPLGGVTLKVKRGNGQPSLWSEMTEAEAVALAEDLLKALEEVAKANPVVPKVTSRLPAKDWRDTTTSKGREYTPLWWTVGEFDPETDPAEHEGKFPVRSNKGPAAVSWFTDKAKAHEITDRLNYRTT